MDSTGDAEAAEADSAVETTGDAEAVEKGAEDGWSGDDRWRRRGRGLRNRRKGRRW